MAKKERADLVMGAKMKARLRALAVEEERTQSELMRESLTLLFEKYNQRRTK